MPGSSQPFCCLPARPQPSHLEGAQLLGDPRRTRGDRDGGTLGMGTPREEWKQPGDGVPEGKEER